MAQVLKDHDLAHPRLAGQNWRDAETTSPNTTSLGSRKRLCDR